MGPTPPAKCWWCRDGSGGKKSVEPKQLEKHFAGTQADGSMMLLGAPKVREGWLLQPVKRGAVFTPVAMPIPSGGFCELNLLWDTCCWYCGPPSSLAPNLGDRGRLWPIFAFRAEDQGHQRTFPLCTSTKEMSQGIRLLFKVNQTRL